jgi:hypothetical protein
MKFVLWDMFNWNPFGNECSPLKTFPVSFEAGIEAPSDKSPPQNSPWTAAGTDETPGPWWLCPTWICCSLRVGQTHRSNIHTGPRCESTATLTLRAVTPLSMEWCCLLMTARRSWREPQWPSAVMSWTLIEVNDSPLGLFGRIKHLEPCVTLFPFALTARYFA